MKRIGLFPYLHKEEAVNGARQLLYFLDREKVQVLLLPETAQALGRPELAVEEKEFGERAEAVVVLGGDGTILAAARRVAPWGTPLLGINVGHLGFLTEADMAGAETAIQDLLQGTYTVDERMMLRAEVYQERRIVASFLALNDVVVNRGTMARIVTLPTFVNGEWVEDFRGDGLIVATPTGSTAYALAAGGPVVSPAVPALLLTPICPHMLAVRPIVLPPDSEVQIRIASRQEEIRLTADGQLGQPLEPASVVIVRRAEEVARLIHIKPGGFFRLLRSRLGQSTEGEGGCKLGGVK